MIIQYDKKTMRVLNSGQKPFANEAELKILPDFAEVDIGWNPIYESGYRATDHTINIKTKKVYVSSAIVSDVRDKTEVDTLVETKKTELARQSLIYDGILNSDGSLKK